MSSKGVMEDKKLNKQLTDLLATRKKTDNGLPLGVTFDKTHNRYVARCRVLVNGVSKNKTIGYYQSSDKAGEAYKAFKEAYVRSVANEYQICIDASLYTALMSYKVPT